MNFFDISLFVAKYTPFWAVPMAIISTHFAYLFWLKDYREIAYVWAVIALFCLTARDVYFLLGGPDGITLHLTQAFS